MVRDAETEEAGRRGGDRDRGGRPRDRRGRHLATASRNSAGFRSTTGASAPTSPSHDADAYKIRITAEGYEPFVSRAFRAARSRSSASTTWPSSRARPAAPSPPRSGPTAGRSPGPGSSAVAEPEHRPERRPAQRDIRRDAGRDRRRRDVLDPAGAGSGARADPGRRLLRLCQHDGAGRHRPGSRPGPTGGSRGASSSAPGRSPTGPIELSGLLQDDSTSFVGLFSSRKVTTDAEGRFAFDKVIPMANLRVARREAWTSPGRSGRSASRSASRTARRPRPPSAARGGRSSAGSTRPTGWDRPVDFTDRGEVSSTAIGPTRRTPRSCSAAKPRSRTGDGAGGARPGRRPSPVGAMPTPGSPSGCRWRPRRVVPDRRRPARRIPGHDPGRRAEPGPGPGTVRALTRTFAVPPIPGGGPTSRSTSAACGSGRGPRPKVGEPAPRFEVTTVDGSPRNRPRRLCRPVRPARLRDDGDDQSRLQIARMNDVFARFGKEGASPS